MEFNSRICMVIEMQYRCSIAAARSIKPAQLRFSCSARQAEAISQPSISHHAAVEP